MTKMSQIGGGIEMDFEINLFAFDEKTADGVPNWVEEMRIPLSRRDEEGTHFATIIQQYLDNDICPSLLHGSFLNAFMGQPISPTDCEITPDTYENVLDGIEHKDPNINAQSWLSELIQNSVDIGATNLEIEISENDLTFVHNGRNRNPVDKDGNRTGPIFTPEQLIYLFKMNTTTKRVILQRLDNLVLVSSTGIHIFINFQFQPVMAHTSTP